MTFDYLPFTINIKDVIFLNILIKNGNVLKSDCTGFEKKDLYIENGKIVENIGKVDKTIDAENLFVMPGFIDIHNHGSVKIAYGLVENGNPALEFCAKEGITTVFPTISARGIIETVKALKQVEKDMENSTGANVGGVHLEGPFISEGKRGAIKGEFLEADVETLKKITEKTDIVKIMTIAPEKEGALEVIRAGKEMGIIMSMGHSVATYDEAEKGIEAGITHSTHTFNAMVGYNHREPGIIGAALTNDNVTCEVICDMVHLSPVTVKLIYKMKGADKIIMISDAGYVTGLADGEYFVDNAHKIVKDGVALIKGTNTIAGSCFSLGYGAKKMREAGIPLNEIGKMTSYNAAKATGIISYTGTLENGKNADIIICDDKMDIKNVFVKGIEF